MKRRFDQMPSPEQLSINLANKDTISDTELGVILGAYTDFMANKQHSNTATGATVTEVGRLAIEPPKSSENK